MQEKGEGVLVSVAGKSGSGKSEFARQLLQRLGKGETTVTKISSDDFYKEHTDIREKELDLEKLQEVIRKLKNGEQVEGYEPGQVIIVEGLQTIEDSVLGQKPDFRSHIETDFSQRMGRRLVRDAKDGFRTVRESLTLLLNASVKNPEIIKKFEQTPDMSGVDLQVENDFQDPAVPEIKIENNKLTFSVGGSIQESIDVTPEQVEALARIGFK